jgi:hypothetical protein
LVQWLGAQLNTDAALAKAAMSGTWQARTLPGNIEHVHPAFWVDAEYTDVEGVTNATVADCPWSLADAEHIAEWDPARVLREIDGRRRTLVRCQEEMLSGIPRLVHFAKQTVREMALPYEGRPGYEASLAAFE